jgi:hypothetical protein
VRTDHAAIRPLGDVPTGRADLCTPVRKYGDAFFLAPRPVRADIVWPTAKSLTDVGLTTGFADHAHKAYPWSLHILV